MLKNNFCGILIKPDTHRQNLYRNLLDEFTSCNFNIIGEYHLCLNENDVLFLYPKETSIPIARKKLIKYLTSGISTLILLQTRKGMSVKKEIAFLQKIKGNKEQKTGLRFKYNSIKITDYEIINKNGNYYDFMMINNFHVFDTKKQLSEFIKAKKSNNY